MECAQTPLDVVYMLTGNSIISRIPGWNSSSNIAHDTFQDLGDKILPQDTKIESLKNLLKSLISLDKRPKGSFQAKYMQMKPFESHFVFSPIHPYLKI